MEHYTIKFNNGKVKGIPVKCSFDIVTNIAEFGLSVESAFISYISRTSKVTVKGFCAYVISKGPHFKCYPKDVYDQPKKAFLKH